MVICKARLRRNIRYLSSKCNAADSRLAVCPSGGPQIRHRSVGFLAKVPTLAAKSALL